MSRRTTGTLLLTVLAILYATRYLAAAIFGSSLTNWSTVALVAGLVYLAWAEYEAICKRSGK